MEIYLVRHTSVEVEKNTAYGQSDLPLKESFQEEAEKIAAKLKEVKFDKIFCSPISRCRILSEQLGFNAQFDNRLKELNFGDWEMQRWDDIKDPRLNEWFEDWINTPTTNGESFSMLYTRSAEFIEELKQLQNADPGRYSKSKMLVITHGGVIASILVYVGVLKFHQAFSSPIEYGSIIRVVI